jgi:hypothetical protein
MTSSQAARARPFKICYPCLYFGLTLGISLCAVMVAWLLIANHNSALQAFAMQRNIVALGLLGTLMLLPAFRFKKSAGRVFFTGVVAWTILSGTYGIMTTLYVNLSNRLGVFHLFILGALIFGTEAVLVWIIHLAVMARHQPLIVTRRFVPPRR